MKKILLALLLVSTVSVFAKTITQKITVKGECDMCKDRIEKALDIPGISFAEWDVESKVLTIRYNDKKITEDQIHQTISNIGYATDKVAANQTAQKSLDKCCQPKKVCESEKSGCCTKKK